MEQAKRCGRSKERDFPRGHECMHMLGDGLAQLVPNALSAASTGGTTNTRLHRTPGIFLSSGIRVQWAQVCSDAHVSQRDRRGADGVHSGCVVWLAWSLPRLHYPAASATLCGPLPLMGVWCGWTLV